MITIIGSGMVGSSIAFLAASKSLDDVTLVNRTREKALGESLDISNAVSSISPIKVKGTNDYSQMSDSDVVVICASVSTYTKNRTETMGQQISMIREISGQVKKYAPESKVLVVSNPADVLTYVFQKEGSFDPSKVIGVASSLDSARFRLLLSDELGVKQNEIQDAIVLGEHGDSMVPIFSKAKLNGRPVMEVLNNEQQNRITKNLVDYWKALRQYKIRSVFGIARNTFDVLESIVRDEELAVPTSVMLNGEYGIKDACIGVPTRIAKDGLIGIEEIVLSEDEHTMLKQSASIVRNYIRIGVSV